MRVNGLFYQKYDLRRYPPDTQYITLRLEDEVRTIDQAVSVAGRRQSGVDTSLDIRPNWIDLRTGIPATAPLTLVFLQVSYSSNLPELSYLVLMDKICVMACAMTIATLLQVIWSNHRLKRHQLETDHEVRRLDIAGALVRFAVFWAVLACLVVMR